MQNNMTKLPNYISICTKVAASVGIVQGIVWLILSSLALSSYLQCNFTTENYAPNEVFSAVLHRYFFLNEECQDYRSLENGLGMSTYHLHVWSAIQVGASAIWFLVSIWLYFGVTEENIRDANIVLYTWSLVTAAISCVDIALGIILGVSYANIDSYLASGLESSDQTMLYEVDLVRLGTLMLMIIALRGFILLIINVILASLILICISHINEAVHTNEHNVNTLPPIYAFDSVKQNNMWNNKNYEYDEVYNLQNQRGPGNLTFNHQNSEAPSINSRRNVYDAGNESLERSTSWHQGRTPTQSQRPFSYLEAPQFNRSDSKTERANTGQASPAIQQPSWVRTGWEGPHPSVPAPDYSPLQARRLKSALKTY